ncbi:MAG: 50S ribosome-binding GTPase [Magnetococcales bacterium]|nr:50S ribosome-binding GTPase [Magnetococcales bacterium]
MMLNPVFTHNLLLPALILAIVLPVLVLLPLGLLWLWQAGYLWTWLIGACGCTLAGWLVVQYQKKLLSQDAGRNDWQDNLDATLPHWTAKDRAAWNDLQQFARATHIAEMNNSQAWLDLGSDIVRRVAGHYYPQVSEPVWHFTLPEALLLLERVSSRLHAKVDGAIPFADQLTIGTVLRIYGWRRVLDYADVLWDCYRVIRLANPLSALVGEIRGALTHRLMAFGQERFAKILVRMFIEEVARAAIDLYGGHLRVPVATPLSTDGPLQVATPLQILIAGQVNAGKSSLVNALLAQIQAPMDILPATTGFTAYPLEKEGVMYAQLIDSQGLSDDQAVTRLVQKAVQCDLLLWVCSADRADRQLDRTALTALHNHFAAHPEQHRPRVVLVVSHIDLLRPVKEWAPPYDIAQSDRPKAVAIRTALETIRADLELPVDDVVPVCLRQPPGYYNVETAWATISHYLPDAENARLLRGQIEAGSGVNLEKAWNQAVTGGRMLWQLVKEL